MSDFQSFLSGAARPPTAYEREVQKLLREAGQEDVVLEPGDTPQAFWEIVVQAAVHFLAAANDDMFWQAWSREMRWIMGWGNWTSRQTQFDRFAMLVRESDAHVDTSAEFFGLPVRLTAIETAMDVAGGHSADFADKVNDRARWLHVGLRVEGRRFVPVTDEHLHVEVVQPTLLLLTNPALSNIDGLYRKAFNRALSNDQSGAITAASSAVEEMLRVGLGVSGSTLEKLVAKARTAGWLNAAAAAIIPKLMALRTDSDSHEAGTEEFELAMFAIHLAGSVLLHLSTTAPFRA